MIPSEIILSILLQIPPCYKEDPDPQQLEIISQAIGYNVDSLSEAAALITIGTFESAWCKSVGSGKKKGGSGSGYWQIEPGSHRIKPFAGLSLENTTHAAGQALWLWRHSHQCGQSPKSRFIAYAGIRDCNTKWDGAVRRSNFYYWVYNKLIVIKNNEPSKDDSSRDS